MQDFLMFNLCKNISLNVILLIAAIACISVPRLLENRWLLNNFVVFLTMTIEPATTVNLKRVNIDDRIADYRKSLSRWAVLPYKVVVVESSGYGNPFTDILKNAPHIQYISTKLPCIAYRGKAYGEAEILKYAMENVIKNDKIHIMKVTGRYAPEENLKTITDILRAQKPRLMVKRGSSQWFVAYRPLVQKIAASCIKSCNINGGGIFEDHLRLLSYTEHALEYKERIKVISTYSGTDNKIVEYM